MGLSNSNSGNTTFVGITGGKFAVSVEEGTEGAVRRDWEVGDKKGTKYELLYSELSGIITSVSYHESNYGEQLNITVNDNGESNTISLKATGDHAIQFAEKLPKVDLSKPVLLIPKEEASKRKPGFTERKLLIIQDGKSVPTHYYDFDKKENCNGIPEPSPKIAKEKNAAKKKALWANYFNIDRYFFLHDEVEKIAKTIADAPAPVAKAPAVEKEEDENQDLPF